MEHTDFQCEFISVYACNFQTKCIYLEDQSLQPFELNFALTNFFQSKDQSLEYYQVRTHKCLCDQIIRHGEAQLFPNYEVGECLEFVQKSAYIQPGDF